MKRVPEAIYFQRGSITFKKIKGVIVYTVKKWDEKGFTQVLIDKSLLLDEEHLEGLKKQYLGSVKQ